MEHHKLLFSGNRLPRGHIRNVIVGTTYVEPDQPTRPWSATGPDGLWRAFSDIDMGDFEQLVRWLTDYGDVTASTAEPPGRRHTIADWQPLHAALKTASQAWSPQWSPAGDQRDHMAPADSLVHQEAVFALGQLPAPRLEMKADSTLVCSSLADYLYASAAIMLQVGTPLRRCGYCGKWFDASHRKALYCSNACRVAAHRKQSGEKTNG